ncbi:hypothetical protein Bca4012_043029 [Brassica carinata]
MLSKSTMKFQEGDGRRLFTVNLWSEKKSRPNDTNSISLQRRLNGFLDFYLSLQAGL